jgi:hypothetical protein
MGGSGSARCRLASSRCQPSRHRSLQVVYKARHNGLLVDLALNCGDLRSREDEVVAELPLAPRFSAKLAVTKVGNRALECIQYMKGVFSACRLAESKKKILQLTA